MDVTKCHGSLGQVSLQVWELHSASILVDGPTGICGKGRLETLQGRGGGLVLVLWRSNGPVTLIENVGHQWLERSDWELGALGRWVPQVDLHAWETSAFKVAGVIMFRRRAWDWSLCWSGVGKRTSAGTGNWVRWVAGPPMVGFGSQDQTEKNCGR